MSFLYFIIFGALVGWIASMVLKTDQRQGLVGDILLGIVGSVIGGWLMESLGQSGVTGFNLYSIIVGILGAIVLVVVARGLMKAMN